MKQNVFFTLIFLFLFPVITLVSQSMVFYADPLWSSAHFSPFMDGKEVKGYCAIFSVPVANSFPGYRMEILDNNLKTLKKAELILPNASRIKHSSFNGDAISVTLESFSGVLIKNAVYNTDGNLISEYEIGKKGMLANSKVHAVPHFGFIGNAYADDDVLILEMRSDSGKVLWKIHPEYALLKDKSKAVAERLTIHSIENNFLILKCEITDEKATDIPGNSKMYFRLYDLLSGKKINDLKKDEEERIMIPYGVTIDTNAILVYGQVYLADKTPHGFNGNESQGIYIHEFDKEGIFIKEYFHPWSDLSSFIKMEDDDSNTSVWLNDMMISPEGVVFLMGELYRYSKVSGVSDMVIFEFNDLHKVDTVHRYPKPFDKSSNSILPPNDYLFGENLKEAGAFGYRYSTSTSDRKAFSFVYSGQEGSGRTKKNIIGAIGLNRDHELVDAKFNLDNVPERMRVLPAKNGYVAVIEYYFAQYVGFLKLYKFDM